MCYYAEMHWQEALTGRGAALGKTPRKDGSRQKPEPKPRVTPSVVTRPGEEREV